jgi:type IV pilus biogenesis protein CpaD/CtpE
MIRILRISALVGLMAVLSACDALEPYGRAYSWHPTGANAINLATMAADPADLNHGRGTSPTDGREAGVPIDRLRHDRVKPLLSGDNGMSSGASGASATAN